VPIGAAAFVLAVALAAYVMVKFYGVIFLGRPREAALAKAHDAGWRECLGLGWLALGCIALGLAPATVLNSLDAINRSLIGASIAQSESSWWLLAPVAEQRASYSPFAFAIGLIVCITLAFLVVRWLYHGRVRRVDPWDCGFPLQTARMQDTAEGFGQPIRHIFGPFFRIERELPSPFDTAPRYALTLGDRWWHWLYLPIARAVQEIARVIGYLQQGRIALYLFYSFATLLALLAFVL
jgi:hypothetical protein